MIKSQPFWKKHKKVLIISTVLVVVLSELALVLYVIGFLGSFINKSEIFGGGKASDMVLHGTPYKAGEDGMTNLLYFGTHGGTEITSIHLISVNDEKKLFNVISFGDPVLQEMHDNVHFDNNPEAYMNAVAKILHIDIQYYGWVDYSKMQQVEKTLKVDQLPDSTPDLDVLIMMREKFMPLFLFAHPFELCEAMAGLEPVLRTNVTTNEILSIGTLISDFTYGPIFYITYTGEGAVYDPNAIPRGVTSSN